MRKALLLSLALVPLGTSCVAAAAGAAAGFLVSREVLPNDLRTATVSFDVDEVWAISKERMEILSMTTIEVQEYPRVITGEVDGADVTIEVHAYDLDRTIVTVDATKFGFAKGETADRVMNAILDTLSR
ncbi:MAG: hypothetical protein AAF682_22950 [Planctomycetota bacterium]